jgi:hypothetical protein
MCIKDEYRKEFKCIGDRDKIIPYRSPKDMRYGTVKIEEYEDHFLILGQNKNNGGNMIKFAKVYPEFPHWNQDTAQIFCLAGILMSVLTAFSTIIQVIH